MDMLKTVFNNSAARTVRAQPWIQIASFFFTVAVATINHWSAVDMAWSFWLAGFLWGLIYLMVYQWAQGDRETLVAYPFVFFFFYFIFAAFLSIIFSGIVWDLTGEPMSSAFAIIPHAVVNAARQRWPFLLFSGISVLPEYILDARTINFTDVGKPLFARDMLRMIILIFLLVEMMLADLGVFALYAILLVYFLPLRSVRQIVSPREAQ